MVRTLAAAASTSATVIEMSARRASLRSKVAAVTAAAASAGLAAWSEVTPPARRRPPASPGCRRSCRRAPAAESAEVPESPARAPGEGDQAQPDREGGSRGGEPAGGADRCAHGDSFVVDAAAVAPSVAPRFPMTGLDPVTSARQIGRGGVHLAARHDGPLSRPPGRPGAPLMSGHGADRPPVTKESAMPRTHRRATRAVALVAGAGVALALVPGGSATAAPAQNGCENRTNATVQALLECVQRLRRRRAPRGAPGHRRRQRRHPRRRHAGLRGQRRLRRRHPRGRRLEGEHRRVPLHLSSARPRSSS